MVKNSHSVMHHLSECDPSAGVKGGGPQLKEKFTHFKLATNSMMKAAEDFLVQARSTNRRWSRALQHERALRVEIQESFEALANQMHGMESEARGMFHPQMPGSSLESSSQDTVLSRDSALRSDDSQVTSLDANGGVTEEKEEEEEEKFFDAPEFSQEELVSMTPEAYSSKPSSEFVSGHKRNVSTASVNEAQSLLTIPEPDHLPFSPDRTMSVSLPTCIIDTVSPLYHCTSAPKRPYCKLL